RGGKIALQVEGGRDWAVAGNWSVCQRQGSPRWLVPRSALQVLTPEDAMSAYTFNKHVIEHHFCPVCGIPPFGEGADPSGAVTAAVNLRCLEDIDLTTIPVQHYDGRGA